MRISDWSSDVCSSDLRSCKSQDGRCVMANEKAILAGGCFWGVQELLRKMDGVVSTRVGYSGGDVPNATYRSHGTHADAVEIVFDPERISYSQLLEFFRWEEGLLGEECVFSLRSRCPSHH